MNRPALSLLDALPNSALIFAADEPCPVCGNPMPVGSELCGRCGEVLDL